MLSNIALNSQSQAFSLSTEWREHLIMVPIKLAHVEMNGSHGES